MMTCTITLSEYLAEYLNAKYDPDGAGYVQFRPSMFVYMSIYRVMRHKRERPEGSQEDGNFTFAIPVPSVALKKPTKRPEYFNYVNKDGVHELEHCFKIMFWGDCHEFLDRKSSIEGVPYNTAIREFITLYKLSSITEEAIWKHYSRYKRKRTETKKREYQKKKRFYNPNKFR